MTTNADVLTKQHKFQVSKEAATRTLQTTLGDGLSSAKFYCSRAKLILITVEELNVCPISKAHTIGIGLISESLLMSALEYQLMP